MARQAPYTLSGNADDLMKEIVKDHLGSDANADRDLSTDYGWAEEADVSAGPSISTDDLNFMTLLDALQDMADNTMTNDGNEVFFGVEVDSVPNSVGGLLFVTRIGQYGKDRTGAEDALTFGLEYGNLEEPELEFTATKSKNTAYSVRYGVNPAYTENAASEVTPFTRHEYYVRGYDSSNYAYGGTRARGTRRPRWIFRGKLVDGPTGQYGKDYDFGDRVLVSYRGKKLQVRISQVRVKVDGNGRPDISCECEVAGWTDI